jgi:hypothetical protein
MINLIKNIKLKLNRLKSKLIKIRLKQMRDRRFTNKQ